MSMPSSTCRIPYPPTPASKKKRPEKVCMDCVLIIHARIWLPPLFSCFGFLYLSCARALRWSQRSALTYFTVWETWSADDITQRLSGIGRSWWSIEWAHRSRTLLLIHIIYVCMCTARLWLQETTTLVIYMYTCLRIYPVDGYSWMGELDCFLYYSIVLYCIVLYCIVLYCIVFYCIVLDCIVLYWIVLYCLASWDGILSISIGRVTNWYILDPFHSMTPNRRHCTIDTQPSLYRRYAIHLTQTVYMSYCDVFSYSLHFARP